jgi:predicted Holliday junction resolvase-like endonuclease
VRWDQLLVGLTLVAGLLVLSIYYAWRQVRTLRQPVEAGSVEASYRRAQVRRRLISSGLLLILAVQLAGALAFLEDRAQRQAERADVRADFRERGGEAQPTSEERTFARFYSAYWLSILVVLLAVVVLAFADLWATRRFAVQAHRQLRAERREMIDRQIARLRQEKQERNGHS